MVLLPAGAHAAQGHAGVFGLDHHPDALGLQLGLQPVGDLFGQAFLDLRTAGEVLDDPGQLGQAEDPRAGQVTDVRHTDERQQMVLADGPHGDAAGQDEFVVVLVVGEGGQVEGARAEQLGVGARHPARCAAQALGGGGDAEGGQELPGRGFRRGQVERPGLVDDPEGGPGLPGLLRVARRYAGGGTVGAFGHVSCPPHPGRSAGPGRG